MSCREIRWKFYQSLGSRTSDRSRWLAAIFSPLVLLRRKDLMPGDLRWYKLILYIQPVSLCCINWLKRPRPYAAHHPENWLHESSCWLPNSLPRETRLWRFFGLKWMVENVSGKHMKRECTERSLVIRLTDCIPTSVSDESETRGVRRVGSKEGWETMIFNLLGSLPYIVVTSYVTCWEDPQWWDAWNLVRVEGW